METKIFHHLYTKSSSTFTAKDDLDAVVQARSLPGMAVGQFQFIDQLGAPVLDILPLPGSGGREERPTFEFKRDGKLLLTVVRPFGGSRLEGIGPSGELVLDFDDLSKRGRLGVADEITWKIRDAEMNRCGYIRKNDEVLSNYLVEVSAQVDPYLILGLALLLAADLHRRKTEVLHD